MYKKGFSTTALILSIAGVVVVGAGAVAGSIYTYNLITAPTGRVLTVDEFKSFPESLMSRDEALQYIPASDIAKINYTDNANKFFTTVSGKWDRYNTSAIANEYPYGEFGYQDSHGDVPVPKDPKDPQPKKSIREL